jgi:hypothetical protein
LGHVVWIQNCFQFPHALFFVFTSLPSPSDHVLLVVQIFRSLTGLFQAMFSRFKILLKIYRPFPSLSLCFTSLNFSKKFHRSQLSSSYFSKSQRPCCMVVKFFPYRTNLVFYPQICF